MDYQGIGMITVFLILVTLFVMSITSKTSGYRRDHQPPSRPLGSSSSHRNRERRSRDAWRFQA